MNSNTRSNRHPAFTRQLPTAPLHHRQGAAFVLIEGSSLPMFLLQPGSRSVAERKLSVRYQVQRHDLAVE